jgi:hypothetical protein
MPIPEALEEFNVDEADVSVWLFRKSRGEAGAPIFTGHWIDTDEALDVALKDAVKAARDGIDETEPYARLAPTEPGQALTIATELTEADQIVAKCEAELLSKKATKLIHVQNTDFYVIKLVDGDEVLHAVKKTDTSWVSKVNANWIKVVFADDQLGLNPNPDFHLSRYIDFFIVGDETIVLRKDPFGQVLSYKEAHIEDFAALTQAPAFAAIFVDIGPLLAFVGNNKTHLKRVCAIGDKGHYANAIFMANLRAHYGAAGLNLVFDAQGRLVATPDTCADIITALLDHRLYSRFSQKNFEVPHAREV